MGYDPKKIQLVLNRADTRVGISQDDVVAVLGREPDVFIPSDREIPRSVNEGVPIVARAARSPTPRRRSATSPTCFAGDAERQPRRRPRPSCGGARRRSLFRFRRK